MTPPLSSLEAREARAIWLRAQGLHQKGSFGTGTLGTLSAVRRLGYVQIDTIYVVERAHHHILWSRIPDYETHYLKALQEVDKSVFEHWTHALSYIPVEHFPHYVRYMRAFKKDPTNWYESVTPKDVRRIRALIEKNGAISMQDIEEPKVEKDHPWAARKPSKRVLEYLFFAGELAISQRDGMRKRYELTTRHFGWDEAPGASSKDAAADYRIDRALGSQGLITLESASFLENDERAAITKRLRARMKPGGDLCEVTVEGHPKPYVMRKDEAAAEEVAQSVWLLSPFDPLVIQRKRLKTFFDFDYTLECYLPAPKRKFGYYVLPVLYGDQFVARLDLKANRATGELQIQSWHWEKGKLDKRGLKPLIEAELERYERFACKPNPKATGSRV